MGKKFNATDLALPLIAVSGIALAFLWPKGAGADQGIVDPPPYNIDYLVRYNAEVAAQAFEDALVAAENLRLTGLVDMVNSGEYETALALISLNGASIQDQAALTVIYNLANDALRADQQELADKQAKALIVQITNYNTAVEALNENIRLYNIQKNYTYRPDAVTLFQAINYNTDQKFQKIAYNAELPDLRFEPIGNDNIQSIKVHKGFIAELYPGINYDQSQLHPVEIYVDDEPDIIDKKFGTHFLHSSWHSSVKVTNEITRHDLTNVRIELLAAQVHVNGILSTINDMINYINTTNMVITLSQSLGAVVASLVANMNDMPYEVSLSYNVNTPDVSLVELLDLQNVISESNRSGTKTYIDPENPWDYKFSL